MDKIIKRLIALLVFSSCFISFSNTAVYAHSTNTSTGGQASSTGGYASAGTNIRYSGKFGAAWIYYTYNTPDAATGSDFTIFNQSARPGGRLNVDIQCPGATGFWALTALFYNKSTGKTTGVPAGALLNNQTKISGGSYEILYAGDGKLSTAPNDSTSSATASRYASNMQEVYSAYVNSPMKRDTWENTGLICDYEGNGTDVHSQSTVTFKGSTSIPVLDGTSSMARTVAKSETTGNLTFDHYLLMADTSIYTVSSIDVSIAFSTGETVPGPSGTTTISSFTSTDPTTSMSMAHVVTSFPYSFAIPDGGITICQTIHYTPQVITVSSDGSIATSDAGRSSRACLTVNKGSTITKDHEGCQDKFAHGTKGTSYGEVNVANFNSTSVYVDKPYDRGTKTIYAKPGDEVRFVYCVGFGPQSVAKITHDSTGSDPIPSNWFRITATPSNNYLFDRYDEFPSEPVATDSKYVIPKSYGADSSTPISSPPVDETRSYEIDFYSPSNQANHKFNCQFYYYRTGENRAQVGTHEVLGSPTTPAPCNALNTGSIEPTSISGRHVTLGNTIVGKTITQKIEYLNLRAWLNTYSAKTTGGCGCDDSDGNEAPTYTLDNFESTFSCAGCDHGTYKVNCKAKSAQCCAEPISVSPYCNRWATDYEEDGGSFINKTASFDCVRAGSKGNCNDATDFASDSATIKIPYNFMTAVSSSIENGTIIYAGETVKYNLSASLLDRTNTLVSTISYLTHTPADTIVQAVRFTTSSASPGDVSENIKADVGGNDLCNYFRTLFADVNCNNISKEQGIFNRSGELNGPVSMTSISRTEAVPDIYAGYKFCVAIGVSHTDSHDMPESTTVSSDGTSMDNSTSPHWHVSGVSCRTIAKRPNFQAWNAGAYTSGNITTSTSTKKVSARLGDGFADNKSTYGSWTEYITLGGFDARIEGLASGAARGYTNGLGGNSATSYCQVTRMSIRNNTCDSGHVGHSGIESVTVQDLLRQIRTRYTDTSSNRAKDTFVTLNNETGANYYYHEGSMEISSLTLFNETRVYEVTGDVYITGNICYGQGDCDSQANRLLIESRNNTRYGLTNSDSSLANKPVDLTSAYENGGITKLPQVIIIADNIYIDENVTQIDAWLFAYHEEKGEWVGGTINTCSNGSVGNLSTNSCNRTIIFNGPVFAESLELNRTAGAYDGPSTSLSPLKDLSSAGGNSPANSTIGNTNAEYGSETPAEIFNLRPDVYFWAYSQSDRYTQAVVTYTRELAPRY